MSIQLTNYIHALACAHVKFRLYKNIFTIALINIHYMYINNTCMHACTDFLSTVYTFRRLGNNSASACKNILFIKILMLHNSYIKKHKFEDSLKTNGREHAIAAITAVHAYAYMYKACRTKLA